VWQGKQLLLIQRFLFYSSLLILPHDTIRAGAGEELLFHEIGFIQKGSIFVIN